MTEPRRRPSRAPLIVHLAFIAAVTAYVVVSAVFYASADVNFGLFFGAFGFVALGVPWSLLVFLVPSDQVGMVHFYVAGVVGTFINLGLHLALRRRGARRVDAGEAVGAHT